MDPFDPYSPFKFLIFIILVLISPAQDNNICDWILENGSKSHIFISVYLSLQHEKYCIPNNISQYYKEFNAQITERM